MSTNLDPERRSALLGIKLRALVASRWHEPPRFGDALPAFAGGAALVANGELWVLTEAASTGLGAVLAWADQQRAAGLVASDILGVVVDGEARSSAGALARQGFLFASPHQVWLPEGRDLVNVAPEPIPEPPVAPAAALALAGELRRADLEVVIDHGIVRGEVDGLEVALVIVDDEGTGRIEVGVGRNDREAFALLHGDLPPQAAMAQVAATVRQHRRHGANPHPLNRMASERWLRSHLLRDEQRLAGWQLEPVPGPVPRTSVAESGPAYARGTDPEGRPVVVACSIGIDLELVPTAADARAFLDPDADLVLAVPARDAHPVTARLAAALVRPARLLPIEGDWRR